MLRVDHSLSLIASGATPPALRAASR
jgi:hypothetical protein